MMTMMTMVVIVDDNYDKDDEEKEVLTRRDREVVDFRRYCVKNNTELTNLGN